jgi:hypothetical protein
VGYNTGILVLNDGWGEIERNPEQFVDRILKHMQTGGTFGVGHHGNPVQVLPSRHASVVQLIAMGGNYATVLDDRPFGTLAHHTEEGQVRLLRYLADRLGYQIVPKDN